MKKLQILTSDGWVDLGDCWIWDPIKEPKVQVQAEEMLALSDDHIQYRIVEC